MNTPAPDQNRSPVVLSRLVSLHDARMDIDCGFCRLGCHVAPALGGVFLGLRQVALPGHQLQKAVICGRDASRIIVADVAKEDGLDFLLRQRAGINLVELL